MRRGRSTLPSRLLPVLAAVALLAAACGDGGSTGTAPTGGDDAGPTTTTTVAGVTGITTDTTDTTTGTTAPPDDTPRTVTDQPLFMITDEGGFASPSMLAAQAPTYVMTADGRLILAAPMVAIYPGPLVPGFQLVEVPDLLPDVEETLGRIGIADITEEIDDSAQAADASTTVLTYFDDNGVHRYGVSALGFDGGAGEDPRSVALSDLLLTLESAAYADADAWSEFRSDRWQVVLNGDFLPGAQPVEGTEFEVRAYPLDIAVADFEHTSHGQPCTILEGDDAAAAAEAFLLATQLTVWDTGTEQIQLLPRPLLPGEEGCSDR